MNSVRHRIYSICKKVFNRQLVAAWSYKYIQGYFSCDEGGFSRKRSTFCIDKNSSRKKEWTGEPRNHTERFLQSYDADFDICRAFLVVSMIIAHVFEQFYGPDYNRNFTAYVTIGFVFISGLTISAIYGQKVAQEPRKYLKRFMRRALKLIALFVVCNGGGMLLLGERFSTINQLSVREMMIQLFIGTQQQIVSFQILIPIAATMFLSWFVLSQRSTRLDLPIIALLFIIFYILEHFKVFHGVGLHWTLVGLMGTFAGKWVSQLPWDKVKEQILASRVSLIAGVFMFAYYATMVLVKNEGVLFSVHIIPTVVVLLFVYLLSAKLEISKRSGILILAEILSEYMLFVYIFHITLINVFFLVIPKDGLDFLSTALVSCLVLALSMSCCYLLQNSIKKWGLSRRIYNMAFK